MKIFFSQSVNTEEYKSPGENNGEHDLMTDGISKSCIIANVSQSICDFVEAVYFVKNRVKYTINRYEFNPKKG